VAALTAIAAALLFADLGHKSAFVDEAYHIGWAARPALDVVRATVDEFHPPLYLLLLHGWMTVAGATDTAARIPSALFGVLLVPLAYAIGRELGGRRQAVWTATFTALSPPVLFYSRVAMWYAFATFLGALSTWAFLRLRRGEPSPWTAITHVVASVLLCYTHYLAAAVVLPGQQIAVWLTPGWSAAFRRRWRVQVAIITALFLPWVVVVVRHQLAAMPAHGYRPQAVSPLDVLLSWLYWLYAVTVGEAVLPWTPLFVPLALGAAVVLGNALGALARDRELRVWAVAFLLVPLAWSPLLLRTFGFTFLGMSYHLLPLVPAWAVVAAAGQARASGWRRRLGVAAVIAIGAVSVVHYWRDGATANPVLSVPWKSVAALVAAGRGGDDVILLAAERNFQAGQILRRYLPPPYLVVRDTGVDGAVAAIAAADAGVVWLLCETALSPGAPALRARLDGRYALDRRQGFKPSDDVRRSLKERVFARLYPWAWPTPSTEFAVVVERYVRRPAPARASVAERP
jgi:4-amino-4-deoxy-L-arabinose transferase-like glycosyltransferase